MTVAIETTFVRGVGNGTTVAFGVPFTAEGVQDIRATVNGVEVTVSAYDANADTVTLQQAPAHGAAVEIWRQTPLTQTLDANNQQALPPEYIERFFDRITRSQQEGQEAFTRSVKVPRGETAPDFPVPDTGKVLAWGDGNAIVNSTASVTDILATADAAAASAAQAEVAQNAAQTARDTAQGYRLNASNSASAAAESATRAEAALEGAVAISLGDIADGSLTAEKLADGVIPEVSTATTENAGIIELATENEVIEGTATKLVPTVSGMTAAIVASSGSLIGMQVFNTVGTHTYTPTEGTTKIYFELVGGGGGGGGTANVNGCSGGGGGIAKAAVLQNLPAEASITIGAGGSGGGSNANGSGGGASSFGNFATCLGGAGGDVGSTGGSSLGGAGGVAIISSNVVGIAFEGQRGSQSGSVGGGLLGGQFDGDSNSGGGAGGYGSGGSGALGSNGTGGAGGGGYCLIKEYK